MQLYNTLTKKIEEFIPHEEGKVHLYTCGPTVYHYAHIGNLRKYIMDDVLEKSLEIIGYQVKRVMNITDVGHLTSDADSGEDKMEKGAKRENKTVSEIAQFYTDAFLQDIVDLNIRKPQILEKATDHIPTYIKMITVLLEKGYAYIAGGNIYFDVSKFPNYYDLAGMKKEDLKCAVRDEVSKDEQKKNPADFVLWFVNSKFENHAQQWESPWGVGYPGWHIECSGISYEYLGEYLDIHTGGVDNIFPHHTNEIAQSEAYLGHDWCHYWLHANHLLDENGKMSKSSGGFLTLQTLKQKNIDPLSYRFFCLQSHYRSQLTFRIDGLKQAQIAYDKLKKRVLEIKKNRSGEWIENDYFNQFKKALENDLNTASALTILFDVIKDESLNNETKYHLIIQFDQVLSLNLGKEQELDLQVKEYIEAKIEEREQAKQAKNYTLADTIRDELKEKGILLFDTKEGTRYEQL